MTCRSRRGPDRPRHPYTQALIDSVPGKGPARGPLEGELPDPMRPPVGCPFHPRCAFAVDRCRTEAPALTPVTAATKAACHRADDLELAGAGRN